MCIVVNRQGCGKLIRMVLTDSPNEMMMFYYEEGVVYVNSSFGGLAEVT